MPVRFDGPVLTAEHYRKGALKNAPVALGSGFEYYTRFFEFDYAAEALASSSNGPWVLDVAVGAVAAPALTSQTAVGGVMQADPGTAASTGQSWLLAGPLLVLPTVASGLKGNFVAGARVAKNANADTFGAFGLTLVGGALPVLTAAGAFAANGNGWHFRWDGSGVFHSAQISGATITQADDTTTHGLDVYDDISIVGENLSQVGGVWGGGIGSGTVRFYVGSKLIQTIVASTAAAVTVASGFRLHFHVVNGTATTGHSRFDCMAYTFKR